MAQADQPLVIFTPSGKRGRFPVGTPVLTAARQLGVDLDSVCGGRGICSRCQITPSFGAFPKFGVTVSDQAISEWNAVEQRYKEIRGLIDGRRLGCQAKIEGDLIVDVPPESQTHKQVIRKRAEARDIAINPSVKIYYIEVQQPDMHDPSGDLERVFGALKRDHGLEGLSYDISILPKLQKNLRKGDWAISCAIHIGDQHQKPRLIETYAGYRDTPLYGLAIDLGSTTIAAHLCDLTSGEVIASSGLMNPQIRFGEDLMSRVSYAMMNEGGDQEMTQAVREGMNSLIIDIAKEASISPFDILDTVIVCNPVMHHLFLGLDPYELGQAPFALTTSDAVSTTANALTLSSHPAGGVYLLPCIAGHVGADAAAVALSESPQSSDDLVLIVDVGTNAEIILGDKTRVLACSSPTGPAFEGAQITSGQRAAPGAIERVEIDPTTKEPRFKVIGSDFWSDDPQFAQDTLASGVTGICGSGIIEAIAEMRLAGIVDPSGLIGSAEQVGSARVIQDGRTHSYLLYDGSADGGPVITVTNPDIRAIQMAKAALYAGARLLMDKFGAERVDRVVLAGAFGAHISPKHAMILGMIPDCALDKVQSAGNAAGTGARIALLDHTARRQIEELVHQIEKIETAIEPRFQEHFVNASGIPNGAEPFPILEGIVTLPTLSFNDGTPETGGRRRRRR